MSDLLFDLPASVVHTVLGEWVQMADLTSLDSAFCHRARRQDLLTLLQSEGLCSKDTYRLQYNSAVFMWDWVVARGVKVTHVTSDCERLRSEDAFEYVKGTADHIRHLDIALDHNIFADHCTKLKCLTCTASFDDQLRAVLLGNPNLQELKLTTLITKKTAEIYNAVKLPLLTQLSIACGDELCIAAALKMAPRLLKLELRGIAKSFPTLGQNCPHLRSLLVCGWQKVRGLDIVAFTSYCPHIVNLELDMCNTVTDADLLGIVKNLPGLRTLRLHAYEFLLTDKGIRHITQYCADTLEVFQIKFCTVDNLLTHASLDELRQRCTKLRTFHCVGSTTICHDLHCFTVLQLSSENLTNPALKKIAESCPELQVMDFWFDVKYKRCTDKGFGVLIAKCPKLHTIAAGPDELPALRELLKSFPQVKVVRFDSSYRFELMGMPI